MGGCVQSGPVDVRVAVAAIGTRGDVLPFAHLAARFAEAGHEVTLLTHAVFAAIIGGDVQFAPVPGDPRDLLAGPASRALQRWDPVALNRTRDEFAAFVHSIHRPARDVLGDADVLIASTFAIAAVDLALERSVPVVRAHLWPEFTGVGGPMPLLPYSWVLPPAARRLARRSLGRLEPYLGGVDGRWSRGRLQLVARHPVALTTATAGSLYAFSPHLVREQPPGGAVTGWWTGPGTGAGICDRVQDVLATGGTWVHAGFGSMPQGEPDGLLDVLSRACSRVGVQAVAQLGDLRGRLRHNVVCIGEEPHDELFRQVSATIHHGGAGTTAAAVRAGTPSVVVPHFADQFWWGQRLHGLGVAARPVARPFLSEAVLARRIDAALDEGMHRRSASLAEQVSHEDGCGQAVAQVDRWLSGVTSR